jgi:hypothetical protein
MENVRAGTRSAAADSDPARDDGRHHGFHCRTRFDARRSRACCASLRARLLRRDPVGRISPAHGLVYADQVAAIRSARCFPTASRDSHRCRIMRNSTSERTADLRAAIRERAREEGFEAVGFAAARAPEGAPRRTGGVLGRRPSRRHGVDGDDRRTAGAAGNFVERGERASSPGRELRAGGRPAARARAERNAASSRSMRRERLSRRAEEAAEAARGWIAERRAAT